MGLRGSKQVSVVIRADFCFTFAVQTRPGFPNLKKQMSTYPASMIGFRAERIPMVRIALLGVGQRGMKTLERYGVIRGAEIRILADVSTQHLEAAAAYLESHGRPSPELLCGEDAWQEAIDRKDIDLIYICTPWETHTRMACSAMRKGKHVAVEVPAATTLEECWMLVETAELTRRHCFMTENCCYDHFALATLEMHREGLFGELTHVEGAYIHNLLDHEGESTAAGYGWMLRSIASQGANAYPTHGMGPIGWMLNLHRGDLMESLCSMTSRGLGEDGLQGRVNTTLIRTRLGITIMQQLDPTTPRPYSRLQTICGTKGYAQKYPLPTLRTKDMEAPLTGADALAEADRYMERNAACHYWHEGHQIGVPNEMNYAMDCRLVHCLHYGLPLDIDVYDAAEWSCIAPLSAISAQGNGRPIDVPDFTRGRWRHASPHTFYQ